MDDNISGDLKRYAVKRKVSGKVAKKKHIIQWQKEQKAIQIRENNIAFREVKRLARLKAKQSVV